MTPQLPTPLDHFLLGVVVALFCAAVGTLLGRGLVAVTLKFTDTAPERPSSLPEWMK